MPVVHRTHSRLRFALVPALFFAAALALSAQQPDTPKKPVESKADSKTAPAPRTAGDPPAGWDVSLVRAGRGR